MNAKNMKQELSLRPACLLTFYDFCGTLVADFETAGRSTRNTGFETPIGPSGLSGPAVSFNLVWLFGRTHS